MGTEHSLEPLIHGSANEQDGRFSPDGKCLSYISDESGIWQLYVVRYPGLGGKWQLTSNGVAGYRWTSDHEIAYQSSDENFYALELATGNHGGQASPQDGRLLLPRSQALVVCDSAGPRPGAAHHFRHPLDEAARAAVGRGAGRGLSRRLSAPAPAKQEPGAGDQE